MFIARISRGRTIREFIAGVLLVTTYFVTSSDSGSLVTDSLTAGRQLDTPAWQRVFWALMKGVIASVLLIAGGLNALQTATITTAASRASTAPRSCSGRAGAASSTTCTTSPRKASSRTSSITIRSGRRASETKMSKRTETLERFRAMLDEARRVVVFTGAGVSTESGIPDFRSPGTGLWNRTKPIEFQDFLASEEVRQRSWERRFTGERKMERAEPNKGHEAIARLVEQGKASAVITQNVDNLHERSGVPPEKIIELHGNASYAKCLSCAKRYEMDDLEREFHETGRVGPCADCGGIIKTATISFGQMMPEEEMRRAEEVILDCDFFLVAGSSLVVYPAAGFPQLAKQYGARLAILNREPTPLDDIADLALHEEIGPVLSYVVGIN